MIDKANLDAARAAAMPTQQTPEPTQQTPDFTNHDPVAATQLGLLAGSDIIQRLDRIEKLLAALVGTLYGQGQASADHYDSMSFEDATPHEIKPDEEPDF